MKRIILIVISVANVGLLLYHMNTIDSKHFTTGSALYLRGNRLDLPEEFASVVDEHDKVKEDTLLVHRDAANNTIYVTFK